MNTILDEQVENKMSGIIQQYKAYYERTHNREFVVGNEKQVIQNVSRNFLSLYFYLFFWPKIEQLDQLDENQVLEKVYLRYLDNPTNRPYMNVFLKHAALYQYEIQFEPSQEDVENVEALTELGLLEFDSETEYHAFYHSDFAKLLLKSYASRPAFERNYHDLQDFTIQQIKAYLSGFEDYPSNFREVFLNLVVNKGVPVFKALLEDTEIKKQTILFYQNIDSAYNLARFLYNVARYAPEQIRAFSETLTINHPSVKTLFLNAEGTLRPFVQILMILQTINVVSRNTFLELFDPEEQKHIVLTSPFHIIGLSLSILRKSDVNAAGVLLSRVATNELTQKAQEVSFNKAGRALSELKNIDADKAKQIFDEIELTVLVDKAQEVSFGELGNALNELKNIDAGKTKEVFDQIELTVLAEKAQEVSFERLGNALNELKNIDADKAKQIFDEIELTVLAEKAQEVSFGRLGNALSELYYVDIEKTDEILNSFDLELLVSKVRQEKYYTFLYHIPAIARINGTISQQLLTKLPDDFLFQFKALKSLTNFNRLLFAFHFSGLAQYAERLVAFASENMDSFMRSKTLKDITSLLNLCSHYLNMKSIIDQYRHKFFGKISFGEPSEIPYFIRAIHDHDKETALELLDNIKSKIAAKEVLGYCFYQLATSCSEQEDFIEATNYLKKAIHVFEEVEDNSGLCYTYFAQAKNAFALNNVRNAQELSKKALSYAQIEGRHDLQEKIRGFITDDLKISQRII